MLTMIYTIIGYIAAVLMIAGGCSIIITSRNDAENLVRDICFGSIIMLFGVYIILYISLTQSLTQ